MCGEHSLCSGHTGFARYRAVCAFPVYTAQAPGCSIWSEPCVECSSSFRVLQKSVDSLAPAFCAFPGLSGSGSQRLGHPLPGCSDPFPSARVAQAARGLGALSPGAARLFPPQRAAQTARGLGAFSLPGPSARRWSCACGLRLFRGLGL